MRNEVEGANEDGIDNDERGACEVGSATFSGDVVGCDDGEDDSENGEEREYKYK